MRNKLKSEKYFQETYEYFSTRFYRWHEEYLAKIAQSDLGTSGWGTYQPKTAASFLVGDFMSMFYSGYSLGLSKKELGKDLELCQHYLLSYWNGAGGSYIDMYFYLAVAIIFELSKEHVEPVLTLLIEEKYEDFVLDSMANFLMPEFEIRTDKVKFKPDLTYQTEVIKLAKNSKEQAVQRLKHYLDKQWIRQQQNGMGSRPGSHKQADESMLYLGYWSLESAALVIMLGLEDTSIKDCKYYPYDLVHEQC